MTDESEESQVTEMNNNGLDKLGSLDPETEEVRRSRFRPTGSQRYRPLSLRSQTRPQQPIRRRPRTSWSINYGGTAFTWPEPQPMSSEYVRWVQSVLNQVLNLQLPADGVPSVQTRSAIRSFQEKNGLIPDGTIGPPTEAALLAAGKEHSLQAQGANSEFEAFEFEAESNEWESEVNRSSLDYIRWVQQSLNQIMGLRLSVDGISGTQTRSAIRSFQQQSGLTVDGVVGPRTEQALIATGAGSPPGAGAPSYVPPLPQPSTSTLIQLAQQVLNHTNISLWPYSPVNSNTSDGADAQSNIRDTASGRAARHSSYGNAPGGSVYLDSRMLDGMLKLASAYRIHVTSIAGGSHSSTSRHYAGIAFDVNEINGVHVTSANPYFRTFMQKCQDLGATEVLGPGASGHDTHVHCAWPRP